MPVLRKRHSLTSVDQPEPSEPLPELPPNRPPRNPARASNAFAQVFQRKGKMKPGSRPSTANSTRAARDEVTPWESKPTGAKVRSSAPSVKSRASSTGLATGPVEDVTPWELFPVPVKSSSTTRPYTSSGPVSKASSSIISAPHGAMDKNTGAVEDVAPWELFEAPSGTIKSSMNLSLKSSEPSIRATMNTNHTSFLPSMHSIPMDKNTGPVEDVAPWELFEEPSTSQSNSKSVTSPAPSVRATLRSDHASLLTSARSIPADKNTGPVEEVAPWELFEEPSTSQANTRSIKSPVPSVRASEHASLMTSARSVPTDKNTGPVEDVAPWELFEGPPTSNGTRNIKSPEPSIRATLHSEHASVLTSARSVPADKNTGPVEDVAPWELFDDPATSKSATRSIKSPVPSVRTTLDSQTSSILSDAVESSGHRLSMATGPTEEVAPWELQPPPQETDANEVAGPTRPRSMSKAELADVMPWELHPPPPVPAIPAGVKTRPDSTRPSMSASKPLGDLGLLRRRRSGGGRPSKDRSVSQTNPPLKLRTQFKSPSSYSVIHGSEEATTPQTIKSVSSAVAFPQSHIYSSPISEVSPSNDHTETEPGPPSKEKQSPTISTTDRKILKEPKRNLGPSNAHFVMKGAGVHLTDGTICPGKKHHRDDPKVPYPRNYEREVIDLDVWETLFCKELCGSLTWHVFEEPPRRVLDLGCGTGDWILKCAGQWEATQFVGLDIVPLHPDLQRMGSSDLASRITWVQANFLNKLPFPNDEFDFVHIKRIALGVPETKWESLLDEIDRVLKPGGALEIVEEDLFFPGKLLETEEDENELGSLLSRSSSITSASGRQEARTALWDNEDGGRNRMNDSSHANGFITPAIDIENMNISSPLLADTTPRPTSFMPQARSSIPLPAFPQTLQNNHSALSFLDSSGPISPEIEKQVPFFGRRPSNPTLTAGHNSTQSLRSLHQQTASRYDQLPHIVTSESSKLPPFLVRTPAAMPTNPRDHSLLEYIYKETLSARFINIAPLAMLNAYLEYHFTGTRSHPPLLYTFPPQPSKLLPESDSDSDEAPTNSSNTSVGDPVLPPSDSPVRSSARSRKSMASTRSAFSDDNGELLDQHRWLTMDGLIHKTSPYVSLDQTRGYAFSPAAKSNFTAPSTGGRGRRESRIPNKTFNIDLRSLNLHLLLRVKEILACSEIMWEWVEHTQNTAHGRQQTNGRNSTDAAPLPNTHRSSASFGTTTGQPDHKGSVLCMSREDFNQLLLNFEMDMHDKASVNTALRERFDWSVISSDPSQKRKIFNSACDKYDKFQKKEHRSSIRPSPRKFLPHASPNIDVGLPPSLISLRNRVNSQARLNRVDSDSQLYAGAQNASAYPISRRKSDASGQMTLPPIDSEVAPTQKLSRSMGVFVAWKPVANSGMR